MSDSHYCTCHSSYISTMQTSVSFFSLQVVRVFCGWLHGGGVCLTAITVRVIVKIWHRLDLCVFSLQVVRAFCGWLHGGCQRPIPRTRVHEFLKQKETTSSTALETTLTRYETLLHTFHADISCDSDDDNDDLNTPSLQNFKVPWRAISTSQAVWACLTAHFCNNWMHYTLVTSLPTFMKEVLHYDIKQVHALILLCYDAKDWKEQVPRCICKTQL